MTDNVISSIPNLVIRLADELEASSIATQALGAMAIVNAPSTLRLRARSVQPTRDTLVVAVVGELNAGKSTLVNALVGQKVAATDGFVCTRSIARIHPSDGDHVVVGLAADGEELTVSRGEVHSPVFDAGDEDPFIEAELAD